MNQNKHMSPAGIESIALEWFKAFNTHDLEKLLSLYDNEAKHYSPKLKIRMPETNGLVTGKEELRGWWRDAFDRLPSLNYVITSLTANESRIFMEYIRKVDGEEDMLIAEILEIRNGLIFASRVYHG
jgi:SnoaL-like domain